MATNPLDSVVGEILVRQQEAMDKQHRLLEMLISISQSNSSTPAPSTSSAAGSSTAPEALMDVISKNIREFVFEPEEGQLFATWYDRYEDIFVTEAKDLDDASKVRILLRKVSTEVFNKYRDYLLPKKPRDVNFAETLEIMKKLYGRKESLFSLRVKCMQNVRGEMDDIVSYAAIVNRHCENFLLSKCSADNFKCLIFVNGLKKERDQEIKARLLNMLEGETETAPITIDKLVAEIQRIESLKRDVNVEENPASVKKIKSTKFSENNSAPMPKRPCWQYGQMHFVQDCKYTNHKCSSCNRIGHKEGFCSCFPEKTNNQKQKPKQNHNQAKHKFNKKNYVNSVHTAKSSNKNRRYVTLSINNKNVKLQHDSGSDVTIISKQTWIQIGKPPLHTSSETPCDASTNSIHIIGELEAIVFFNNTEIICNILVSSIPDLNLFGADLMEMFELWNKPVSSYTSCNNVNVKGTLTPMLLRKQFPEVFREEIGHVKNFKIHLPLKENAVPVFRPKRQVPYAVKKSLDETLDTLEREGIISSVNYSDWAAPIVVVKKSSGKLRICGDYSTGLNDQLEAHNFPLPLPDDIFVNFNSCSTFSIIDLNNAYMQLEVDDDTKKLLVINTHRGLYTFNRLAQGVKSAPGAFQQAIQTILSGVEGAYPYLDDVIIATTTREQNEKVVKQVLERLKIYNMTVNFEKCQFFKSSCTYLGYHIDSKGISPDKDKIEQIRQLPPPTNISQLRSYLGAVNYYGKFLVDMRKLRDPLDNLLKKNAKWNWSKECQQSFLRFKQLLSSDLLLTHYDPRLQIKVAADASNVGLGAYICHVYPNGTEKAIYHCSRALTPAEKNYSQIEKEALALVFAVVKFHKYLYGRKFILQTDHKPLLAIFSNKKGIPAHSANRLQRWALTLMSYDFELQYVSTNSFGAADILSRLIDGVPKPNEDTVVACIQLEKDIKLVINDASKALPITFNMIRDATAKDDELQTITKYLQSGKWPYNIDTYLKCYFTRKDNLSIASDCLMFGDRVVIPKCFRKKVLKELHKGHDGIERTKNAGTKLCILAAN